MLADKHGIEAFFHQLLAGPSNGVDAGIEGGGDSQSRHPSPVSEASAFSRMRALVSCRAGCFPARISVLSPFPLLIAKLHHVHLLGNLFRGHEASPALQNQRVRDLPQNQ
jgi:hypothetical protein